MSDSSIYRLTGVFGLACVVFWLSQFPLYMMDGGNIVYDGVKTAQHLYAIRNIALTRILLDLGVYVTIMVFAAGFRHLTRQARPEQEWIGTLVFGTVIVWLGVTLVADGLQGGAVLDTLTGNPDPSAVRALNDGTFLIYNGPTAFTMTAFFLVAAGYATFSTGVLPKWTGWIAYTAAGLCLACVPAMYMGPVDANGFYNPGGWGPAIAANFPPAIWFVSASISMIRKHNRIKTVITSRPK